VRLTARGRRDASTRHNDDAANLAGLDVLGNSGKAALSESLWRSVIADNGRVLTHFASALFAFAFTFGPLAPGFPRLDAKVVAKVVKDVTAVVGVSVCRAIAP